MTFFTELARPIAVICGVAFFSIYAHFALSLWQALPVEEEKSTPIYIAKELYK